MNLLVQDITTFLSSEGYGVKGQTLFAGMLPSSPGVATAVILTGGPVRDGDPTNFRTFQILHRTTHVSSGLTLVTSLHSLLKDSWRVSCYRGGRVTPKHPPGPYYVDKAGLFVYTLNYQLTTTVAG